MADLVPWVFTSGWASGVNAYAVVVVLATGVVLVVAIASRVRRYRRRRRRQDPVSTRLR